MSTFLEFMSIRYNDIKHLPITLPEMRVEAANRRKARFGDEIEQRCKDYAAANKNDPFAYNRAKSHYDNGVADTVDAYSQDKILSSEVLGVSPFTGETIKRQLVSWHNQKRV